MIKTFIAGIVLGVTGMIAALHFVPVVDQHREDSVISVTPNGGNSESFQMNIPMDRIMVGDVGDKDSKRSLPPGLAWPDSPLLLGSRTELFKLRNSRNAVIGVASRLAANNDELGSIIEWVLHLPARGSMYITLDPQAVDGSRTGSLRAGSREFESLIGNVSERWIDDTTGDEDAPAGRIELVATFVSNEPADLEESAEEGIE